MFKQKIVYIVWHDLSQETLLDMFIIVTVRHNCLSYDIKNHFLYKQTFKSYFENLFCSVLM
jgi:hypothetical protein